MDVFGAAGRRALAARKPAQLAIDFRFSVLTLLNAKRPAQDVTATRPLADFARFKGRVGGLGGW